MASSASPLASHQAAALVQFRDQLGLAPLQLSPEQLAKQVVVAVPVPVSVQRDQRQVGVLQRRKDPVRPAGVKDRVAQRPREALQHRRPGQEHHQLR